jgi:hypothetical protein
MSRDIDAEVLAYIRQMTPAQLVTADSVLLSHAGGGDIVTALKQRQRDADARLVANLDSVIGLLRVASPDSYRMSRTQTRTLRGMLHAATDGENDA